VQVNLKPKKFIERIDWLMVALFIVLALIGVLSIYSVEHRDSDISFFIKIKGM
jgi:cell division protein FtsW (lipid II flippase)